MSERKQLVVWLDNWYRKRFGTDPVTNDLSLNVSVMAILHTTALPRFPGHLKVSELFTGLSGVVQVLLNAFPAVRKSVSIVLEQDLQPEWIRVPLDVHRRDMRSLQWLPYGLTDQTVSSQIDLLAIFADLDVLRVQSRMVLPLLVDMDIHYRIMNLLYGQSTLRWDYAAHLVLTPVLYGVYRFSHIISMYLILNLF